MKGLKSKPIKALSTGTRVRVTDNSGAKIAEIVSVKGYHGVKRRIDKCGVGDVVICAVKVGNPEMKHKLIPCVVVRQKKEFRRKAGYRLSFEDNAVIVMKDLEKGEPKGTVVKGPIAREAVDRFSLLNRIANIVV